MGADKPLCKDEGQWCNPTNYPETKVERILSNNSKIVNFLDKDNDIFIELRSFDPYFENVCTERTEYIYPRAAKNKEENWMFIVIPLKTILAIDRWSKSRSAPIQDLHVHQARCSHRGQSVCRSTLTTNLWLSVKQETISSSTHFHFHLAACVR